MLAYIKRFQQQHHRSPSDVQISVGLNLTLEQVRARLNRLLNEGQIMYSFTLCGKSIEIK